MLWLLYNHYGVQSLHSGVSVSSCLLLWFCWSRASGGLRGAPGVCCSAFQSSFALFKTPHSRIFNVSLSIYSCLPHFTFYSTSVSLVFTTFKYLLISSHALPLPWCCTQRQLMPSSQPGAQPDSFPSQTLPTGSILGWQQVFPTQALGMERGHSCLKLQRPKSL